MDNLDNGTSSQDGFPTVVSISRAMQANPCHQNSTCHENTPEAAFQPAREPYKASVISEGFLPTEEMLRSALADAQSQQGVLQTETSLARILGEQLLSDALATKVADLLSKPKPQVLEADEQLGEVDEEEDIHWLDLIQEPQFEPQCQDNGNYQCHILKRNALVQISAWDHDLVFTCRQLFYTQTYLCDMLAERDTLESMAKSLSTCNQIASDFIKTNQTTLVQITSRLQPLEERLSQLAWTHQAPLSRLQCDSTSEEDPAPKQDETASDPIAEKENTAKQEELPCLRRWTSQHLKFLLPWYKNHEHLPDDMIEKLFQRDFCHYRSCGAIRAAVKREAKKNRKWHGEKKRATRRTAEPEPVSLQTTPVSLKAQLP